MTGPSELQEKCNKSHKCPLHCNLGHPSICTHAVSVPSQSCLGEHLLPHYQGLDQPQPVSPAELEDKACSETQSVERGSETILSLIPLSIQ